MNPPEPPPIPRTLYLARVLWLCFFPVFTVVVGNGVLLVVPQAREALHVGSNTAEWKHVSLAVAFLAWMLSAWYTARQLVGRRFEIDTLGGDGGPFEQGVTTWLPRGLAVAAGYPIAVSLLGDVPWLGIVLLVLATLVTVFVVWRREIVWLTPSGTGGSRSHAPRFNQLSPLALGLVVGGVLASFLLLALIVACMEPFARALGSPALLLFALASWTIFGGMVLTYLPKSRGGMALTWLPPLLVVAFSPFNENHVVRPRGDPQTPTEQIALKDALAQWCNGSFEGCGPVILVATAGGASRAAYWTSTTLGWLEDRHQIAHRTFAISSVSGGSVGAAAFISALEAANAPNSRCAGQVQETGNEFTGRDHLATVTGFLLFPDLIQRFLPFPIDAFDRSRGLEAVWERDWDAVLKTRCGFEPGLASWRAPLAAKPGPGPRRPALLLNTAALGSGSRVMQSRLSIEASDAIDLLSTQDLNTLRLTLSQAVHNSARFPYVSPAGVIERHDGKGRSGPTWDRLGDGGYIEASGTLALLDLLRAMERAKFPLQQVHVLLIDNTPSGERAWLCREGKAQPPQAQAQDLWLPELLAPPAGLYNSRSGRARAAERELLARVGGCEAGRFAEIRLPRPVRGPEPSMNWMLSAKSRQQMTDTLTAAAAAAGQPAPSEPHPLLAENLTRVRCWLAAGTGCPKARP